jgi:hypothetical protein
MSKMQFKPSAAKETSVIFFFFSVCVFGVGYAIGDIPLTWGVPMTLFFTLGAYVIGGYRDVNVE